MHLRAEQLKNQHLIPATAIDWKALGAHLRRLRERYNASLRSVAKAIGVSAPYLSDVERGNRTASNETLEKLVAHLDRLELKDRLKTISNAQKNAHRVVLKLD